MKLRTGFVSNSSSCSYIIAYNDEGYLKNAEEILEFIKNNKRADLYILGKELSEGNDFFFLDKKLKELILRFPERWKANGDKVQALVPGPNHYTMVYNDLGDKTPADFSEYAHTIEFWKDHSCEFYDDEKDLEDFYSYYIMGEWPEDVVDSVEELPKVKPYVILSRDSFIIENEEQWNSIINNPDSFPLMISKGNQDKDFVRALTMTGGVPDYEISYRDFFYFSKKEANKELLKPLFKKVKRKGIKVYTDAYLSTRGESPWMYPLVFHAEPMIGSYMVFKEGEEIDKL